MLAKASIASRRGLGDSLAKNAANPAPMSRALRVPPRAAVAESETETETTYSDKLEALKQELAEDDKKGFKLPKFNLPSFGKELSEEEKAAKEAAKAEASAKAEATRAAAAEKMAAMRAKTAAAKAEAEAKTAAKKAEREAARASAQAAKEARGPLATASTSTIGRPSKGQRAFAPKFSDKTYSKMPADSLFGWDSYNQGPSAEQQARWDATAVRREQNQAAKQAKKEADRAKAAGDAAATAAARAAARAEREEARMARRRSA